MNSTVRFQLSVMMFLQFFVWGAWYVTAPNYLGTIGFQAVDLGNTYSVGPFAGILTPLFVGLVADRFFSAQKVLGVLHLLGALIMFGATRAMQAEDTSPDVLNFGYFLGYMLTYYPTLALTNTVALKNMSDPEKEFPGIRVLGTIGWITANWVLTLAGLETGIGMFYLAAGAALLLGLFSFTLPSTPPVKDEEIKLSQLLGLDALALFKNKPYFVFIISSMLICIPLAFYYQIASRVVELAQLPIGGTMSCGQISEIVFMLVMPFFFVRLGVKWMLAVGMLAWVTRYALFALGAPDQVRWMIIGGVVLHGICYDFFFVTGQIYTDKKASKSISAQAQGLLVMLTLGLGMLIGAQIAGQVEKMATPQEAHELNQQVVEKSEQIAMLERSITAEMPSQSQLAQLEELKEEKDELRHAELAALQWRQIWGIPAILAAVVLVAFVLLFDDREVDSGEAAAE